MPFFEDVCAAGDIIARLRPFFTEFLDCGAVDGIGELLNQHVGEIRHRRGERELQRFRVQSLHAQSIGLRLALQNLRRALYFRVLQVAAVRCGGFGIGEAAEAVNEIFGGNRVAVAPFCIAQVERPNTPFIRRLPFQRQRRNGFAFGIRTDQAIHHLTDNRARRHIRAFLRVERTRFDRVADDDFIVFAALEFGRGLDFAMTRRQCKHYGKR